MTAHKISYFTYTALRWKFVVKRKQNGNLTTGTKGIDLRGVC